MPEECARGGTVMLACSTFSNPNKVNMDKNESWHASKIHMCFTQEFQKAVRPRTVAIVARAHQVEAIVLNEDLSD